MNRSTEKIQRTLIELMATTPIDEITVTELCKRSGVNRATFYYHYDSVQGVLLEIEKQVEAEFYEFIKRSLISDDGAADKSFYVMFFEFVARHADICKLMLEMQRQNSDSFLYRAMEAGRSKVIATMTELYPNCPTAKVEYYYIFMSHGFIGLMSYWLKSGMRESVEEIAEIGENLANNGMSFLA